jgi:hypothetical protein
LFFDSTCYRPFAVFCGICHRNTVRKCFQIRIYLFLIGRTSERYACRTLRTIRGLSEGYCILAAGVPQPRAINNWKVSLDACGIESPDTPLFVSIFRKEIGDFCHFSSVFPLCFFPALGSRLSMPARPPLPAGRGSCVAVSVFPLTHFQFYRHMAINSYQSNTKPSPWYG